jgi:hypothetical protein
MYLHAVRFAQIRSASGGGAPTAAVRQTCLQESASGADIGKNAALARRYDHELEILGALLVDAARERCGEVHFARPRAYGPVRIGDCLVGDARQPPQNIDLLGCLDLAQARQDSLRGGELRPWQQLAQCGQIACRQIVHLDADPRLPQAVLAQEGGEHAHGVELELVPHRDLCPGRRLGTDGARLHVDDDERDCSIRCNQYHRVTPAHERLRRRQKSGHIGEIFGRG